LPREINPQIPEALEKITIHATEKQKEKRYATAQEFADALKKYLDDENEQETKKIQ
jgi:alkanesulfonate monooxygenase SsuD/methylene tetrahydromethanopterin reductase-like flavin-dependent oxidoreductase (luciferase family)